MQLKDNAAVTGKILAEKNDQIVIDIGYTTLVIPRAQVLKVLDDGAKMELAAVKVPAAPAPASPIAAIAPLPAFSKRSLGFGERAQRSRTGKAHRRGRRAGAHPQRTGLGLLYQRDGFLITNFHVTEDETQISIEVYHQRNGELDRKTYKQVRIVALNKFGDLALLKVDDQDAPKFKYVELGSADALSVGEKVFAIGSPLGLERTVTEGILSTKTREMARARFICRPRPKSIPATAAVRSSI